MTVLTAAQKEKDFPILSQRVNGKPLVYLDSASSSLTPRQVLEAMDEYYTTYRSNVHRAIHYTSEKATAAYERARDIVAHFVGAERDEVVFTKGATEAINFLACALAPVICPGDEIVLTEMEHHSNLVPWQQLEKRTGAVLRFISVTPEGKLDYQHASSLISEKTKIVSCALMSNALGTKNNLCELARLAHKVGAVMIVDAAQAVLHMPVNIKDLECDALCFSGHKMLGPTGIGVLAARRAFLDNLQPVLFGGEMITEVTFDGARWNETPWKFEAGTPPIAEAIGLSKAAEYLQTLGMQNIQQYERSLTASALKQLGQIRGLTLYGPKNAEERGSIFSFTLEGIHPHDVAAVLDQEGIAIRAGHLCAMPLVTQVLRVNGICRASFTIYNTEHDITTLIAAIKKTQQVFNEQRKH